MPSALLTDVLADLLTCLLTCLLAYLLTYLQLRRRGQLDALGSKNASSLARTLRALSASVEPDVGTRAAKCFALIGTSSR